MKKLALLFAFALATVTLKAQSGYNYSEYAIGGAASYIRGYTNLARQDYHPAFSLDFIYNYNPYLPIAAEIQLGTLSGGGTTVNRDKYGRQYNNNYIAFNVHADFQLGAGIDYEGSDFLGVVKNFYVGPGIGLISNSNKVQRTNLIAANGSLDYVFPGKDKSIDFAVPIRIGYEFKIYNAYNEPSIGIDVGYIHNFVFGEGLDGYNDPTNKFKNNATDQYTQFYVGLKFNFGNVVSYNKLIRHFYQ